MYALKWLILCYVTFYLSFENWSVSGQEFFIFLWFLKNQRQIISNHFRGVALFGAWRLTGLPLLAKVSNVSRRRKAFWACLNYMSKHKSRLPYWESSSVPCFVCILFVLLTYVLGTGLFYCTRITDVLLLQCYKGLIITQQFKIHPYISQQNQKRCHFS